MEIPLSGSGSEKEKNVLERSHFRVNLFSVKAALKLEASEACSGNIQGNSGRVEIHKARPHVIVTKARHPQQTSACFPERCSTFDGFAPDRFSFFDELPDTEFDRGQDGVGERGTDKSQFVDLFIERFDKLFVSHEEKTPLRKRTRDFMSGLRNKVRTHVLGSGGQRLAKVKVRGMRRINYHWKSPLVSQRDDFGEFTDDAEVVG